MNEYIHLREDLRLPKEGIFLVKLLSKMARGCECSGILFDVIFSS